MTSSPNRGDDVITMSIRSDLMEHHNGGGDKKGVPGCASLFPWPTMPHPRGPWHSDICYHCKGLGHWKKNCPIRRWENKVAIINAFHIPHSPCYVGCYYYYPYNGISVNVTCGCNGAHVTPNYCSTPQSIINYTV